MEHNHEHGSTISVQRPQYGRRTLIQVVEEKAAQIPSPIFAYTPRSNDAKDGWKPISYRQLLNAVDHFAHELVEQAKRRGKQFTGDEFPTIAYVGPSDVRYAVVLLACIKAHHKAFYISPRNSAEGQVSLLKKTDCNVLYYAQSYQQIIQPWIKDFPIETIMTPSPEEWLHASTEPFAYSETFEVARWQPLVVLHTSGSTGVPKPIVVRQGSIAIGDGLRKVPDYQGAPSIWSHWGEHGTKLYMGLPLFHAAGVAKTCLIGIYYGPAIVFGIADRPLTADLYIETTRYSGADVAVLPPSVLEDLSTTEEGIQCLLSQKIVGFGGGNLTPSVGDFLVERGVALCNIIASTESVPYPLQYQKNIKLWQYFIINSKLMGAEFRPVDWEEDVFEMFICRQDPKEPNHQSIFYTFPDKTEWSTGDLFRAHPVLPDHWAYDGRADNVIVFSNGEKLNPTTIEDKVQAHPQIKAALVVGQERFQAALILELYEMPDNETAKEALINAVWPLVEEANKASVAHGHIVRSLVTVSDPAIPFSRTPKGTVQRNSTVKLYKDFIDLLYEQADTGHGLKESITLDMTSSESLTQSIVDILVSRIGNANVGADTDLFTVGVDSLQVISLSKLLSAGLENSDITGIDPNTVAPRVIYANPTPKLLANRLLQTVNGSAHHSDNAHDAERLASIITQYTSNLPEPNSQQTDPLDDGQTILVTGTTGSLGAYILDQLVSNPRVSKIIALNRGEDGGRSRQPAFNDARGLTNDFSKVEFLGVDLSLLTFGLSQADYDALLASADRIIHNAWPVNFVINVSSFEPSIRGVRHLIDFANKAAKRVPIIFISSIGTVDGWMAKEPVPERQLDDLKLARMGYGQSKLAASLILDAATEQSGVPAAIVRVGQIGGPRAEKGIWNPQEFIPSLIASSVTLGILPDTSGPGNTVNWMPVEDVAGLILDVAGVTAPMPVSDISGYFHCVNPAQTSWSEIVQVLKDFYSDRIARVVSLEEWIKAVEDSAGSINTQEEAAKNPAVKLLDIYRAMAAGSRDGHARLRFEMERTMAHSQTIRSLGSVDGELIRNWCKQWRF